MFPRKIDTSKLSKNIPNTNYLGTQQIKIGEAPIFGYQTSGKTSIQKTLNKSHYSEDVTNTPYIFGKFKDKKTIGYKYKDPEDVEVLNPEEYGITPVDIINSFNPIRTTKIHNGKTRVKVGQRFDYNLNPSRVVQFIQKYRLFDDRNRFVPKKVLLYKKPEYIDLSFQHEHGGILRF